MDAKAFRNKFGKSESEAVAIKAGTNYEYFKQISYGFRRPSFELANRLVEASDGRLDLLALMSCKKDSQVA